MIKIINLPNAKKQFPVIYKSKNSCLPILGPLAYSVNKLNSKAFGTIRNQLQVIDTFYQFFQEKDQDLGLLLLQGDFQRVFEQLFEFLNVYLIGKVHWNNKAGTGSQIGYKAHVIKSYLTWSLSRYVQSQPTRVNRNDKVIQSFQVRLNSLFRPYSFSDASTRKVYKSLSDEDFQKLLQLVHPNYVDNPFQEKERRRNYLIIQLLLSTGIRLGELLTIQSSSIKEMNGHFYLSIYRNKDMIDTRKDLPSIKNIQSERTISISEDLYDLSISYILNDRRPIINGKKKKLNHGFLFTSSLGNPLSKSAIANFFISINNLQESQTRLSKKISPHMMRHTFCDRFLKYLIEVCDIEMDRAKDELRAVCGWTTISSMPIHYAGKYISLKANEHNINRIIESYKRYEQSTGKTNITF